MKRLLSLIFLLVVPLTCYGGAMTCYGGVLISGNTGSSAISQTYSQSTNKTAAEVITLPIQLYQPAAAETTITITPGGTARPSTADYGTGKNYTLSATTCTILQGATTPASPITLTVYNQPNVDINRVASISFSDSHNYALVYTEANITIVDNARTSLIDVSNQTQLTAISETLTALDKTGATTCTANLIAIRNYVYDPANGLITQDVDGRLHGAVLYFPAGTYLFNTTCDCLRPGIAYIGDGASTIIKGNSSGIGRLWTYYNGVTPYPGMDTADSFPIIIKTMTIDDSYTTHADHCDCVFVNQYPALDYQYRAKFIADTVTFKGAGYAGLYVYVNIDAQAYNCNFAVYAPPDINNYAPVPVVCGGGHSKLVMRNCYGNNTALECDREVQSAAGYGPSSAVAIENYNSSLKWSFAGDSDNDNSFKSRDSTNIECSYIITTNLDIDDSSGMTRNRASDTWNGAYGTVANQTITGIKSGSATAYNPYAAVHVGVASGQTLTFDTCTFNLDDAFQAGDKVYGIKSTLSSGTFDGMLYVTDCVFNSDKFFACIWDYKYGVTVSGTTFNGTYAYQLYGANSNLVVNGGNTYNTTRYMYLDLTAGGTLAVTFTGEQVAQSANYIKFQTGTPALLTITGSRTIIGASAPASTDHGFVGDIFTYGGDTWDCTVAGYEKSNGSQQAATWVKR